MYLNVKQSVFLSLSTDVQEYHRRLIIINCKPTDPFCVAAVERTCWIYFYYFLMLRLLIFHK